eukprot:8246612-Pyramimonas_sp.AAC.1
MRRRPRRTSRRSRLPNYQPWGPSPLRLKALRGSARAGEQLGAAEGGPLALSRRPVVDPAGTPRRSW